MSRVRLLDLFSGAGGAAMGYGMVNAGRRDQLGPTEERAWAAGFFDGEGSVSVHRDKRPGRQLALSLSIEQTDTRPLERFKSAVGWPGAVVARRPPRALKRRPLWRLFTSGDRAVEVIAAIWPWLSGPKREQITRVVLELTEARNVAP